MKRFLQYINKFLPCRQSRDIALVLGGGGARGFAHIGVIEVLQERGYNITSVAGTSMGALVGGLFAAGKLDELKSTVLSADRRQILSLLDVSLGLDHIATADNLSRVCVLRTCRYHSAVLHPILCLVVSMCFAKVRSARLCVRRYPFQECSRQCA